MGNLPFDPEPEPDRPVESSSGRRGEVAWRLLTWFWLPLGGALLIVASILVCFTVTCVPLGLADRLREMPSIVRESLAWLAAVGYGVAVGLVVARVLGGPLR